MRQAEIDNAVLSLKCRLAGVPIEEVRDPETPTESPAVGDFANQALSAAAALSHYAFDSGQAHAEDLADQVFVSIGRILKVPAPAPYKVEQEEEPEPPKPAPKPKPKPVAKRTRRKKK